MAAASVPSLSARAAAYETQIEGEGKLHSEVSRSAVRSGRFLPGLCFSCPFSCLSLLMLTVEIPLESPQHLCFLGCMRKESLASNNMKCILLRFSCCESSFPLHVTEYSKGSVNVLVFIKIT